MTEKRPAVVVPLHRPAPEGATLEERDDDALMALAAADHRRAFEILAARHLAPLTRFCAKFLGSPRAGEEVALEALVEVWAGRRRYQPSGRFRVLLLTVARSRCLNRVRDERRRTPWAPALVDAPAADPASPGALDALLEREREREVRAAILELPPKLREAILLRFDQGLDYAEIARAVGRSEATVRSRVFLAVKRLRAALPVEEP